MQIPSPKKNYHNLWKLVVKKQLSFWEFIDVAFLCKGVSGGVINQ